jgi:hypothetical protein
MSSSSEEVGTTTPAVPKTGVGKPGKSYADSVEVPQSYPLFSAVPNTPANAPFFHFKVKRAGVSIPNPNPDELPKIDDVAKAWAEQYHEFITDPVIQFVSTVAGFLEEKTESLLIDQFSNLKKVFENMSSDKQLAKYRGAAGLDEFVSFVRYYATEMQNVDVRIEYTKLFFLIQSATDQYFSPLLSSHVMKSIADIKKMSQISPTSQIMFFYLVRHEYWMNKFAKLVAASIRLSRTERWVSTKKFQVERAIQEHNTALQEFQNFTVKNLHGNTKRPTQPWDTSSYNQVFTIQSNFDHVNI